MPPRALANESPRLPERGHDRNIIGGRATLSAGVFHDVQTRTGTHGGVPHLGGHKPASEGEAPRKFLHQGVVAKTGASPSGAWATVNVVAPTAAVLAAPAAAERNPAGAIAAPGDPQTRANLKAHGLVGEAQSDLRGGA